LSTCVVDSSLVAGKQCLEELQAGFARCKHEHDTHCVRILSAHAQEVLATNCNESLLNVIKHGTAFCLRTYRNTT
jgi:hypothetical protein